MISNVEVDDKILREIELATEEIAIAGDAIKADSMEIIEIRRNNKYPPYKAPGFFTVLGLAFKGLFTV